MLKLFGNIFEKGRVFLNKQVEEDTYFLNKMSQLLTEYTGFDIKINGDYNIETDILKLNMLTISKIGHPELELFTKKLEENIKKILPEDSHNGVNLDLTVLNNLKEMLTIGFLFGLEHDKKRIFESLTFLKDVTQVANQTYENKFTSMGILQANLKQLETISKKNKFQYYCFDKPLRIKQLLTSEKPLLRVVESDSLHLVLNENFEAYAFLINIGDKLSLSEVIIDSLENDSVNNQLNILKETFLEQYSVESLVQHMNSVDGSKVFTSENPIVKTISSKMNSILSERIKIKKKPSYVYFKLKDSSVDVYSKNDFVLSFYKGEWKLKNFYILEFIILFKVLLNYQKYQIQNHVNKKGAGKRTELKSISLGINKLVKTIKDLSTKRISSLIVILSEKNIDYNQKMEYSVAKNKLNTSGLFIPRQSDPLYTKIINKEIFRQNLRDIGVNFLTNLSSVDGALVLDLNLNILSYAEIIDVGSNTDEKIFGTGTNATKIASKNGGIAIKISEDGDIKVFWDQQNILNI